MAYFWNDFSFFNKDDNGTSLPLVTLISFTAHTSCEYSDVGDGVYLDAFVVRIPNKRKACHPLELPMLNDTHRRHILSAAAEYHHITQQMAPPKPRIILRTIRIADCKQWYKKNVDLHAYNSNVSVVCLDHLKGIGTYLRNSEFPSSIRT